MCNFVNGWNVKGYCFLLFIAVTVGIGGCSKTQPEMLLNPDQSEIIFKDSTPGESLSHTFFLENKSRTEVITLISVEKTCNCTTVQIDEKIIPSKAKTKLISTLTAERESGLTSGMITLKWRLGANPKIYQTVLTLKTRTMAFLDAEPGAVMFNAVPVEKGGVAFILKLTKGLSAKVWREPIFMADNPAVKLRPIKKDEDHYELQVSLDPTELPVGPFKDIIHITYKNNGEVLPGHQEIPVSALIKSDVSADPRNLYFGSVMEGQEKKLSMRIVSPTIEKLKFVKATAPDGAPIKVTLTSQVPRVLTFDCIFTANQPVGDHSGSLLFEVVSGRPRHIIVPYVAAVKSTNIIDPAKTAVK